MSRPMDPTLRAGIVALLRTGHAAPEIADLLECAQKSVAVVQRIEMGRASSATHPRPEHWSAGRRGAYDEDLNADIRMMLAEDRPTSVIAKECRVSEELVRKIRQNDCPTALGTHRVEDQPLDDAPFRIGRAGAALRFESIAACYADCLAAGEGAVRRVVFELRALALDHDLPDPIHGLLVSTLQERDGRRLTNADLAGRLDEISARLKARPERAAEAPARRQRAS